MRSYSAAGLIACLTVTLACGEDTPTGPTGPSPVSNAAPVGNSAPIGNSAGSPDSPAWGTAATDGVSSSVGGVESGAALEAKAVTGFDVYLDVQGRVVLGWQEPEITMGLRGYMILEDPFYIVEYHVPPGGICDPSGCTYVVGWLPNGLYTYVLGAVYNGGADGPTSTDSLTLDVAVPPAVTEVVLEQQTSHEPPNSVLVSWAPIMTGGVVDRTVYQYEVDGPGGHGLRTVGPEDCDGSAPNSCSQLYEALSLDEHVWWVRARTSGGWGPGNGDSLVVTEGTGTPFTAAWENVPATYTHPEDISFGLRFSEEAPLSYRTLRRGAILVFGGTVRRARRAERGSNIAWNIVVRPTTSAGDVTVMLAGNKACGTRHAICTADSRRLSNSPEVTIRAQ